MNKNKTTKHVSRSLEGLRETPTPITRDSIIIVSGGMDSITMLYEFRNRIALGLSFDYGSNHNAREIPFAELHCKRLDIPHITISLDFMSKYSSRACSKVPTPYLRAIMMRSICSLPWYLFATASCLALRQEWPRVIT